MPAFGLTIGGIDVIAGLHGYQRGTFSCRKSLGGSDSASFQFIDVPGTFDIAKGKPVEARDGSTVIFTGFISSFEVSKEWYYHAATSATVEAPRQYVVQCEGFDSVLDRRLVPDGAYSGRTAGAIAQELRDTILAGEGFNTQSFIVDGGVVTKFETSYGTARETLRALGQLVNQNTSVDVQKRFRFQPSFDRVAPFAIVRPTPSVKGNVSRVKIDVDFSEYANKLYLEAGSVEQPQTEETITGDGTKRVFVLENPVLKEPQVSRNGVGELVGVRNVDTGRRWYWEVGSREIQHEPTEPVLGVGQTAVVTYVGSKREILIAENASEITARQTIEGGAGLYEKFLSEENIITRVDAQQRVDAELARVSEASIQLAYEADDIIEPRMRLLDVGMSQNFDIDGIYDIATGRDYLITSIDIRHYETDTGSPVNFKYSVKGVNGPERSKFLAILKQLQRSGSASGTAGGLAQIAGNGGFVAGYQEVSPGATFEPNLAAYGSSAVTITEDIIIQPPIGGFLGQDFRIKIIQGGGVGTAPGYQISFDVGAYRGVQGLDVADQNGRYTMFFFQVAQDGKAELQGYLLGREP